VYLTIAFATYRTWGMPGLVIANTAQLAFHALVTAFFLFRAMRSDGGLRGYGIISTALKAAGAAAALGLVSYGMWWALSSAVPGDNLLGEAVLLGVPALVGGGVYAALVWSMRLPEVELVLSKVRARLGRGR
jgi:putative peptidoglycan lipid II flippase